MSHTERVLAVAFSPDSEYLATASGNDVWVWEAASGKQVDRRSHKATVIAVAFGVDGQYLATASGKDACVWEARSDKNVACIPHADQVSAVALSVDGQYLAAASGKNACVWEIKSRQKVRCVSHDDWVNTVAFSPDGRYLATGSADHTARVWEVSSGHEVARMLHGNGRKDSVISRDVRESSLGDVRAVAFSPAGQYLATASTDFTARVWEVSSGREV